MKKSSFLGMIALILAAAIIITSIFFVLFGNEIILSDYSIDDPSNTLLFGGIGLVFGVLFAAYSALLIKRISPKEYIYISYAAADKDISLQFYYELEASLDTSLLRRYKVLTAEDVRFGDSISKSIDKFISHSNYVIVLLSPEYVQSPFAMEELSKAESSRATLIPVLLTSPSTIEPFPQKFIGLRALELYDAASPDDFEMQISRLVRDISRRHIS